MVPKQRAVVAHYRQKVPSEETQMPRSAQDYEESSELDLLSNLLGEINLLKITRYQEFENKQREMKLQIMDGKCVLLETCMIYVEQQLV
ncbi:hypothetical protein CDAR_250261 [Caerostris darwini]|uniref:Uncharacterized protein n=1 Tax=Caerostris darwini TaxID=1538125 RepID=A0AAV4QET1_9ARAC|nr:hypothetical protein CDAR_250261 [Caerostris darwini]